MIMPCYKMGRFIGEALESVGKQTYTNWEVIAVDDCGPEDGTREAIESFAKQFPNNRIIYHRHEKNGGVSAARNTAIGLARGEYLAFLDPDDWWKKEHLLAHITIHSEEGGIGVATVSGITHIDSESGLELFKGFPNQFEINTFPSCLGAKNPANPSAVVVKKSKVVDVGLFDTAQELQHVEDWDLWIKIIKLGVKFVFIPKYTVVANRHNLSATHNVEKMEKRIIALNNKHKDFMILRNMEYIYKMYHQIDILGQKIEQLQESILKNPFFKIGYRINKFLNKL